MLKSSLFALSLAALIVVGGSSYHSIAASKQKSPDATTETVQKLVVGTGTLSLDLNLNQPADLTVANSAKSDPLQFSLAPDSFFTIVVANDVFRSARPGLVNLIPQNSANLPAPLSASLHQLVLEKAEAGAAYELVLRDNQGFVFFNIEGHNYEYDASKNLLSIENGRLLLSEQFASSLNRPTDGGTIVGKISLSASMRVVEITNYTQGEARSDVMPSAGSVPGPDVIVGDLNGLSQEDTGSAGGQVGLSVGTDSCNIGVVDLDWFALNDNNHPVIPQNMYRMSGGTGNDERFEQIGQSSVKHAFTALTQNICSLGCNNVGGTHLGSGCSDPYVVSLNSGGTSHNLGSRAWINPFTGVFPRGDSATPPNSHSGHTHNAVSHRMLVNIPDLNTTLNTGATYYTEAQYITPHEYVWCQAHAGQCNMFNNVSYRRYNVTGTTGPFSFGTGGFTTQRMLPAINAWTGATLSPFQPDQGNDGQVILGYKITNPSAGVWHYEYAVYNQNLDRGIQSFSIPIGTGVVVSNIGFHAPPQQPGWTADGTVGSAGYSSTAWTSSVAGGNITWNCETFATNPNANAIRWGTLYNFRFDANKPPATDKATFGFFKIVGTSKTTAQVPSPDAPSPTPGGTATPTPAPTATPTPPPTATPTPTPGPTATPTPVPPVSMVMLPTANVDPSTTNFSQPVMTTTINSADNLVAFQGDFTFNETIITFQSSPVSAAGLTSSNWNVSGNVIPGAGPIRTLRVSAFSNDFTPLSGSGILYNLNMTRVSSTVGASTPLTWKPDPDNFAFIDDTLNLRAPASEPSGSITIQAASVAISGSITYCSDPTANPVPGVTMTLLGGPGGSTSSSGTGTYSFIGLNSGGNYTVTPTKPGLAVGAAGITTVDVVAIQRHFLSIIPLTGCHLTAGDVSGGGIDTVDVIAVQRFFLGYTTGIANVGKYQFTPVNRTYTSVTTNQTAQDFSAIILGDVSGPYADRPGNPSPDRPDNGNDLEIPGTVSNVSLPQAGVDQSKIHFVLPVTASVIDAKNNLVGFQGDFTFDERVANFQPEAVRKSGLTAGNWNVSANVLDGIGPIRTLRVSAYSTDFKPLSGQGTLFELQMIRVGNGTQSTPLIWAASPNQFIFIDANLHTQRPMQAGAGNISR